MSKLIFKSTNHTFLVGFGKTRTGKTVQYRILDHTGAELEAYTATGVFELAHGQYGLQKSFSSAFPGFIQWKNVTDDIIVAESIIVVEDIVSKIVDVFKIETGRWKIINNQMIYYDTDGVTALYTFNLLDSAGNATMQSPAERTVV